MCHPDKEKQHIAIGKLYEMLATKSFAHLRSVFDRYEQLGGESVEQLIECDFPGDDEGSCLKAAANAIRQPEVFFATQLSRYYDVSSRLPTVTEIVFRKKATKSTTTISRGSSSVALKWISPIY